MSFIQWILRLLRCVCPRCCELVVPKDAVLKATETTTKPADLMTKVHGMAKARRVCCGCGLWLPKYSRQGQTIKREWKQEAMWQFIEKEVERWTESRGNKRDDLVFVSEGREELLRPLVPSLVAKLFAMVDLDVWRLLGMNPDITHPKDLLLTTLVVPPPIIRPNIMYSESWRTRSQDEITSRIHDTAKIRDQLAKLGVTSESLLASTPSLAELLPRDPGQPEPPPRRMTRQEIAIERLQQTIAAYMNNESSGSKVPQKKKRSGQPEKCLIRRLKGKKGRFRGNLMGKRVNQCARGVVSPDPNIRLGDVGVPEAIALKLTFPETVTVHNIKELQAKVLIGANRLGGARSVTNRRGVTYGLDIHPDRSKIRLQLGWVVERYMQEFDYVLFNRQPSLRKKSVMAHRVRIMDGRTLRLHPCCTSPYNADFDGDEMNLHFPQTPEAMAEARALMRVSLQIMNAQNNKPCIGGVQDALLGGYKLTNGDVFLDRTVVSRILSRVEAPKYHAHLPMPAIVKAGGKGPLWTGKQVASFVIPDITIRPKLKPLAFPVSSSTSSSSSLSSSSASSSSSISPSSSLSSSSSSPTSSSSLSTSFSPSFFGFPRTDSAFHLSSSITASSSSSSSSSSSHSSLATSFFEAHFPSTWSQERREKRTVWATAAEKRWQLDRLARLDTKQTVIVDRQERGAPDSTRRENREHGTGAGAS